MADEVLIHRKPSFWQMMFYLSWGTLTVWFILKMFGIINTPEWLGFGLPTASLIIGGISLFLNLINSLNSINVKLALLSRDVEQLNLDAKQLKEENVRKTEFQALAKRVEIMENKR